MLHYSNNSNLSLFAQVFLATDYYDKEDAGLSVTTLLKPIKQVIMAQRVAPGEKSPDVADRIPSAVGSAVHDGFERAWKSPKLVKVLMSLRIPEKVAHKVRVNPTPEEVAAGGIIPVFTEIRVKREVNGVVISGQFDFIGDGTVEDLKNTSVYKFVTGDNESYVLQGSMYRWLNPEKVSKPFMNLTFNFTDWSRKDFNQNPEKYPPQRMMTVRYNLLSLEETEAYIINRVATLMRLKDAPEEDLPPCSDKELWRKPDQYRYFSKVENADKPGARSTKNFDNEQDAIIFMSEKGNAGAIRVKKGQVTACKFCEGFLACKQAQALIASGDLVL